MSFPRILIEISRFAFVDIIILTNNTPLVTVPLLRDLRIHSFIDIVSLKEESSNFMDSPPKEPRARAMVAQDRDSLNEYENRINFKKSGKKPTPSPKGKGKAPKRAPTTKGPRVNADPRPLRIRNMSEESCLYCQEKGHWKRDCPKYREDCAKGIVTDGKSFSNVHVIEINSTYQNVWILDTGCVSHLCNRV